MSSITLQAVAKRFGDAVAVDGVSLEVAQGEFVSLLGPSGCGKTTTLRMIAGFIAPSAGDIRFDTQSVVGLPPYRRNIGMVFQSLALFPHMSVFDNVAYGLRLRRVTGGELAERVQRMLDLVQLGAFAWRMPDELSGGQRQRVAFARALAIDPKILLLDEPFAALDRKLREEMQVELRRLHERLRITTVFVTHDQREAFTLSDRIAVINHGRIEQVGTPFDVYYRPATRFIADFVGVANLLPARIESGPQASDGQATVVLKGEGVTLQVPLAGREPPPGEGYLFIRPEFVLLDAQAQDDGAALTATVTLVRFVGEQLETRLETRGGNRLVATYQGAEAPAVETGQSVRVRLAARHASLLT